MFKKLLPSLALVAFFTGCGGEQDTLLVDTGSVVSSSQNEFMDFVGVEGDRVFFALDNSSVSHAERRKLDRQIEWLKTNCNKKVVVEGHCDARGTSEYNLGLGNRRAASVRAYLISKGIAADRIKTVSYGKERPAVPGSCEASYRKNRRGVTVIVE